MEKERKGYFRFRFCFLFFCFFQLSLLLNEFHCLPPLTISTVVFLLCGCFGCPADTGPGRHGRHSVSAEQCGPRSVLPVPPTLDTFVHSQHTLTSPFSSPCLFFSSLFPTLLAKLPRGPLRAPAGRRAAARLQTKRRALRTQAVSTPSCCHLRLPARSTLTAGVSRSPAHFCFVI